jgi:large repetitive protein
MVIYKSSSTHSINIIAPSGGEYWNSGQVDTIRWSSTGVTNARIDYTTNNGTAWITITASTPSSSGFYNWTIPNTPSTNCKVKISDANDTTINSTSTNVFTISSEPQGTWQSVITPRENGNNFQSLIFGQSPLATDGIDLALGESSLPPVPPSGVFDSRFELPIVPSEYSIKDFRIDTMTVVSWIIRFQPGSGGYPMIFNWDKTSLPEGTFFLKDMITGTIINVNMKTVDSYTLTSTGITSLKIEYTKLACRNVSLNSGWNMISVPLKMPNMITGILFPDYTSPTYGYNNGYQSVDTLTNGLGYWIRYNSAQDISLCGSEAAVNTIPIKAGWNIIGGYDSDIPVSSITTTPASILTSSFYGYNNSYYQPTTLQPGKGYWIRASQNGVINISNGLSKNNDQANLTSSFIDPLWGRIIISDTKGNQGVLYETSGKITLSNYDLPPVAQLEYLM